MGRPSLALEVLETVDDLQGMIMSALQTDYCLSPQFWADLTLKLELLRSSAVKRQEWSAHERDRRSDAPTVPVTAPRGPRD